MFICFASLVVQQPNLPLAISVFHLPDPPFELVFLRRNPELIEWAFSLDLICYLIRYFPDVEIWLLFDPLMLRFDLLFDPLCVCF